MFANFFSLCARLNSCNCEFLFLLNKDIGACLCSKTWCQYGCRFSQRHLVASPANLVKGTGALLHTSIRHLFLHSALENLLRFLVFNQIRIVKNCSACPSMMRNSTFDVKDKDQNYRSLFVLTQIWGLTCCDCRYFAEKRQNLDVQWQGWPFRLVGTSCRNCGSSFLFIALFVTNEQQTVHALQLIEHHKTHTPFVSAMSRTGSD